MGAIISACEWLQTFRDDPEWDGGALHLNYAGHGAEPDGALVLSDSNLSVDEFLYHIVSLAHRISVPERLRLSVVLDSCHSGAWVTRILDECLNRYYDCLTPFNLFASCMQDEFAFEDSAIGHGLFTYCFSVRPSEFLGGYGATAVLPDNTFGPSLAIAANERGCSLLSAGAQNPVAYWNGAGELEVSKEGFPVQKSNGQFMSHSELFDALVNRRKMIRRNMVMARPGMMRGGRQTDSDMRRTIRKLRESLKQDVDD